MRQHSAIRSQRSQHRLLFDCTAFISADCFLKFSKHAVPCFRPEQNVSRSYDIAQEVDTLVKFPDRNFIWVKCKTKTFFQEKLHWFNKGFEILFVARNDQKVVRISEIIFYFQFAFYEMIKFIHVHICKELGSEVSDRNAASWGGRKTFDDSVEQKYAIWVFYFRSKNFKQRLVDDAIKKLSHIAFQRIASSGIVAAFGSKHISRRQNPFMCTFAYSARKRSWYESRLKYWIEYTKDRMVQDSVPHRCFMYPAYFRIANPKAEVGTVPISLFSQISIKLKDVFFHINFKFGDIRSFPFIVLKHPPCGEKVFGRNY